MNDIVIAVKEGRGYEIILAIYQLLKQAGDPDPAGHNSEIQDCLEFCRELSLNRDQDSQEQLVAWIVWLANELPSSAQDMSFVNDSVVTSELAQNALSISEDEYQRRLAEREETWSATCRNIANDQSPQGKRIRLVREILKKLELLETMPQTHDIKAVCEQVDKAVWEDAITANHLEILDNALAITQSQALLPNKTPTELDEALPTKLNLKPSIATQDMAAPGHWYHSRRQQGN